MNLSKNVVLSVNHLYKKYNGNDLYANYDVNLDICSGEIVGLLGPNGAGKTTLIRQICGTLTPTKGNIYIDEVDIVKNTTAITEKIGSLSQIMYAQRNLKVYEFIYYTGIYRGLTKHSAIEQTEILLKWFKCENIKNQLIYTLSGGEKRITAFLSAIIGFRPLIILDEPTNDMDTEHRILLWKILKQMREEIGTSVLLVTHNVYEAQDVVNRVAIMQNGHITHFDAPDKIIASVSSFKKIRFYVPYDAKLPQWLINKQSFQKIDNEVCEFSVKSDKANEELANILNSDFSNVIDGLQIISPSLTEAYMKEVEKSTEEGEQLNGNS